MKSELKESFCITEEDFLQMSVLRAKCITPGPVRMLFRISGVIVTACGVAAFINIRGSLLHTVCWILLIAVGLFVFSYYDVIDPFITQKQAQAFYKYNSDDLISKTVIFNSSGFSIYDEFHKISIPAEYIYKAVEGKNILMIFIDKEEYYFIPKRVLSDEDLADIKTFIGEEKYKKEV